MLHFRRRVRVGLKGEFRKRFFSLPHRLPGSFETNSCSRAPRGRSRQTFAFPKHYHLSFVCRKTIKNDKVELRAKKENITARNLKEEK